MDPRTDKDAKTGQHGLEQPNQYSIVRFLDSVVRFHKEGPDLKGSHGQQFKRLYKRWNQYLADFLELGLSVKVTQNKTKTQEGVLVDANEYEIMDKHLWRSFARKWHVHKAVDYEFLLGHTHDTIQKISKYPIPEFRKLLVTDLPVELLECIFQHTTMPGPLSSTCRYLRAIGQQYMFKTRTLKFGIPDQLWRVLPTTDEDRLRILRKTAQTSKHDFLRSAGIVIGRPDLSAKLEDLYLADDWMPSKFERIVYGFNPRASPDFYKPIMNAFSQVLASSINLMTLTLSGLTLSLDMIRNICHISRIHSLRLFACTFRPEDLLRLRDASLSCSAHNLQCTFSSASIWFILLIRFPNLQTFGTRNEGENDVILPAPEVWSRCAFFHSMQRLSLASIHPTSVSLLPNLLALHGGSFIRLTHFKLYTRRGVPDVVIFDVLDALRMAPLEALVLDGIAQGSLAIIDRIAEHFPNLLGLTLMRRENERQQESKLVTWPRSSWEYAPRFSAFRKLQHFGWNFLINEMDCSPRGMVLFEEGFLDRKPTFEELYNFEEGWFFEDDHYFEDDHCLALPFAAHCPTLQTFVVTDGLGGRTAFRISRASDGAIETERPKALVTLSPWNIGRWNPFPWTLGWENIIPAN